MSEPAEGSSESGQPPGSCLAVTQGGPGRITSLRWRHEARPGPAPHSSDQGNRDRQADSSSRR